MHANKQIDLDTKSFILSKNLILNDCFCCKKNKLPADDQHQDLMFLNKRISFNNPYISNKFFNLLFIFLFANHKRII